MLEVGGSSSFIDYAPYTQAIMTVCVSRADNKTSALFLYFILENLAGMGPGKAIVLTWLCTLS